MDQVLKSYYVWKKNISEIRPPTLFLLFIYLFIFIYFLFLVEIFDVPKSEILVVVIAGWLITLRNNSSK